MPAVKRLVDNGAKGREISTGKLYTRLINGDRGGYLGYAMWRRYLKLAHGYTAAHADGIVKYTAHELRHVCASGATDMQVANQMGHSKIEKTKNIYGHLFASDREDILKAMNQAVTPPLRPGGHGRRGRHGERHRMSYPQKAKDPWERLPGVSVVLSDRLRPYNL